MTELTNRPTGKLLLDLLLGALRVHDEQLNTLAIELIGRCGEEAIRRLIQAAANRKNRPAHRLRALQAIRRIGQITDLAAYLDLSLLVQDKNQAIRAAVDEILADLHLRVDETAGAPDELPPPTGVLLPVGSRSDSQARADQQS